MTAAKQDKPSRFVDPKKKLPLTKEHYAHLQASGISDEVIKERGYETIGFKSKLKELGFSSAQQRCEGILMPLYGVTGEVVGHQYKPDHHG